MANNILANFPRKASNVIINLVQRRHMPVNVPPTATGKRRFRLAVETDPHKLVNYCCGLNYHIDEPMVELKPDNEYPDWLWNLRITAKPHSSELEKGTKEYYLRLMDEGMDNQYLLRMSQRKPKKVVSKVIKTNQEYLHRLRFAALAHMEDDAGLEATSMEKDWWSHTKNAEKARDYYLPMDENSFLYKDKIEGNIASRNYHRDEESTFKSRPREVNPRPQRKMKAIQDSKRRDFYSIY